MKIALTNIDQSRKRLRAMQTVTRPN